MDTNVPCIVAKRCAKKYSCPDNFFAKYLDDLARWIHIGAHQRHDAMLKTWGWR